MIAVIKFLTVWLTLIDVRVTLLDQATVDGRLVRITADQIFVVDQAGQETSVLLAETVDIHVNGTAAQPVEPASPDQAVRLVDGSTFSVSELSVSAESVQAKLAEVGTLQIPRTAVRAIRLQPLQDNLAAQWNAFLQRSNSRDLMIVPKRDGEGLDFLSGVVSSVGPEKVPFLLDGDEIPVPRSRVFGIVFGATEKETGLRGSTAVPLAGGSLLKAVSVGFENDQLSVESSWGQQLTVAAEKLSHIDFSGGRIHYLSDLEPLSEQYFGLDPPGREWGPLFEQDRATRTGLSRQWKMSRDSFPNSGRPPLSLRNRRFAKGLCLFPSARVEYALDGKYSALKAVVGVDDEVAYNQLKGKPTSAVELRVEADGQQVFQQLIGAQDEPLPLDLNLTGVNTLTIFVEFGDGSSTCDYLDIADARLLVDTSSN
ncbi:MAG: NPCBM/NEW2 domain-containing protein [Fuerstiella sp.]